MKLLGEWCFFLSFLFSTNLMAFDHKHQIWSEVLSKNTDESGSVKYRKLFNNQNEINTYLKDLSEVTLQDYRTWNKDDRKAFLINAYNALTIRLILDHYPVESIRKIGGIFKIPWKIDFFRLLGGELTNLDEIEHDTLRDNFEDFRIHAALNCASISCPTLRREAFVGDQLDEQLDQQMRAWLDDGQRNRFLLADEKIQLSKIFRWYKNDFELWGGGVKKVLRDYGPKAAIALLHQGVKITYLDYNWDLNES